MFIELIDHAFLILQNVSIEPVCVLGIIVCNHSSLKIGNIYGEVDIVAYNYSNITLFEIVGVDLIT